jgi:hypothetical protein
VGGGAGVGLGGGAVGLSAASLAPLQPAKSKLKIKIKPKSMDNLYFMKAELLIDWDKVDLMITMGCGRVILRGK